MMTDNTARSETYYNLKDVSAKLEEFIAQFHGSAGFDWYEAHLQEIADDMRGREAIGQWLDDRERAGKLIDPVTAKVCCMRVNLWDPYGVEKFPPEICDGKVDFACSPESDGWVSFDDLPEETVHVLRARIAAGDFDKDEIPF